MAFSYSLYLQSLMEKHHIQHLPAFYQGYVAKAAELPLLAVLEASLIDLQEIDRSRWTTKEAYSYFPGKWTLNELLQHVIDTERVMSYRALAFARGEQQALPGYDENLWAANCEADGRNIEDLLDELMALRESTIRLFKGFSEETLLRSGIANDNRIDVLALGFIIAGHEKHHFRVAEEYYL
jgi:hypothetical protein